MSQDQNETRNHERRPWYAGIFSRSEPEREQPKKPVRAPSGFDLEDHFPQAREEKAIGQLVSKLKLFLDSHVEEYYVIKPHRLRTGGERSIEPLSDSDDEIDGAANSGAARTLITNHGLPFPSSSDPYSTRGRVTTADPRTGLAGQQLQDHQVAPNPMRRSTIFRTIVQLLLSCIDPYGKEMETFLPKEVVLFFSSLPKQDRPEPGYYPAIVRWKRTTSYLLDLHRSPKYWSAKYLQERETNIDRALAQVNSHFGMYSREDERGEKDDHLREIMNLAATLSIVLLSQPAIYDFRWEQSQGHSTARFPGLWKVTNNSGIPLTKPELIAAPDYKKKKQRPSRRTTSDLEYRRQSLVPRNSNYTSR